MPRGEALCLRIVLQYVWLQRDGSEQLGQTALIRTCCPVEAVQGKHHQGSLPQTTSITADECVITICRRSAQWDKLAAVVRQ
ncbi:hypothetical protein DL546_008543 [Coniochaeta pulveracea]|uniref:Uncharacterized protein n=1 Tax=Coniochaeta pulveracea TaxID=177199 RepID=A0A420YKM0_9PEZI|nr:hypothetical protein DL546_008543 [Coniochaeta pulveracea]